MSTEPQTKIRVGVGGWIYEPWRDNFYPHGLVQAKELEYASRQLTTIEINSTYYRTQTSASFAKWRDATPDGFVFSVKASRYCTNRKVLAEAGEAIERFVRSTLELGPKLGPLLWQFAPTKEYDEVDFGAFLSMLPRKRDGTVLRHVIEVRNASFASADYLKLARQHKVATVFADSLTYPSFADSTADFIYARLMRSEVSQANGYTNEQIRQWAKSANEWREGKTPANLPCLLPPSEQCSTHKDVFLYFISGAKERNPAAAKALLAAL